MNLIFYHHIPPFASHSADSTSGDEEDFTSDDEDNKEILVSIEDPYDDIEHQNLRNQANDLAWKHQFKESAKMYFQLFDRNVSNLNDSMTLKNVICRHLEKSGSKRSVFSFSDVNTIKSACKKILGEKIFKGDMEAKNLLKHLNAKTRHQTAAIENMTGKTLSLLKYRYDENSLLALLPEDVIQTIALQCLAIISEINQSFVDISYQ